MRVFKMCRFGAAEDEKTPRDEITKGQVYMAFIFGNLLFLSDYTVYVPISKPPNNKTFVFSGELFAIVEEAEKTNVCVFIYLFTFAIPSHSTVAIAKSLNLHF